MDKSGFIRIWAVEPELELPISLTSCSLTMNRLQRPVFTWQPFREGREKVHKVKMQRTATEFLIFFLPHRLFKLAGDVYAYIFIHIHTDAHVHISVCVYGGAGECNRTADILSRGYANSKSLDYVLIKGVFTQLFNLLPRRERIHHVIGGGRDFQTATGKVTRVFTVKCITYFSSLYAQKVSENPSEI